ncbi:hypothetical protein SapgrDRAFT_0374 [Saprospira grandis DSM 2844]|uniref:Lipoprotein n=1 Tax=Saprospira grandis DSM 2844 TaxID=694433 RepID=J1I0G1_9BACT|nr:hypothetical protein [Saprospira grandis]EJF52120.1 hypothetical protein SapgrDRAFT_0374 [Saprospira grandis DSM 2844]
MQKIYLFLLLSLGSCYQIMKPAPKGIYGEYYYSILYTTPLNSQELYERATSSCGLFSIKDSTYWECKFTDLIEEDSCDEKFLLGIYPFDSVLQIKLIQVNGATTSDDALFQRRKKFYKEKFEKVVLPHFLN